MMHPTEMLLELISLTRLQEIRPMYKNQSYIYILEMNNLKLKLKTIPLKMALKRKLNT